MGTDVYFEHNRVVSEVHVTEEGLFISSKTNPSNDLPNDISSSARLTVDVVHEVQLVNRAGDLLILNFDVPKAMNSSRVTIDYPIAGPPGKERVFTDTTNNSMPTGVFNDVKKAKGDTIRNVGGFPAGSE